MDRTSILTYYDRMRGLLEHEDKLELHRIQSLFAVQTILFGALAFALGDGVAVDRVLLVRLLAGVGVISALSFGIALALGSRAIHCLLETWKDFGRKSLAGTDTAALDLSPNEFCALLGVPPVLGYCHADGFPEVLLPSRFAPWLFAAIWIVLVVVL
jgi:hypothetical protein